MPPQADNTVFQGRIASKTTVGKMEAVVPEISGSAYITGLSQFVREPDDPSPQGFRITGTS